MKQVGTENDKASLSKILDIEFKTTNINVEQSVIENQIVVYQNQK